MLALTSLRAACVLALAVGAGALYDTTLAICPRHVRAVPVVVPAGSIFVCTESPCSVWDNSQGSSSQVGVLSTNVAVTSAMVVCAYLHAVSCPLKSPMSGTSSAISAVAPPSILASVFDISHLENYVNVPSVNYNIMTFAGTTPFAYAKMLSGYAACPSVPAGTVYTSSTTCTNYGLTSSGYYLDGIPWDGTAGLQGTFRIKAGSVGTGSPDSRQLILCLTDATYT